MPFTLELELASFAEVARTKIDLGKHITTLSSGALVLLAAFFDKLSVVKFGHKALDIGIALLLLTIVTSILSASSLLRAEILLRRIGTRIEDSTNPTFKASLQAALTEIKGDATKAATVSDKLFLLSEGTFVSAMICIGIFIIKNVN